MEKNTRDIYEMYYDRDFNKDGSMRPNKHLGRFEVVSIISDDMYSEEFIGNKIDIETNKPTGQMFKIIGREKSGIGGGTSYRIEPVSLCSTCGQSLPKKN
jgi:hypothetical protein